MVEKPTFGNIINLCVYDDTIHTKAKMHAFNTNYGKNSSFFFSL